MLHANSPHRHLLLACLLSGLLACQSALAAPEPAAENSATKAVSVTVSVTVTGAAPQTAPTQAPTLATATDPIMDLLGERGLLKPFVNSALANSMRKTVRDTASDLVMTAMNFLGVPYKRGGNSESTGFDCSGFTRHIFENSIGLALPRRADEQAQSAGLLSINRAELKPGDLVFFNTMKRTFSHVGIYVGDDKFIHAPRTGAEVRIEDMRESYWSRRFTGARRADLSAATLPLLTSR